MQFQPEPSVTIVAGCTFKVSQTINGDCQNTSSGSFLLTIDGTGPYTITWLSPTANPNNSQTNEFPVGNTFQVDNLPVGTYSIAVTDSCAIPNSQTKFINIAITSSTCVSVETDTTICGLSNGSLTATTESFYGQAYFSLYRNGVYVTSATTPQNYVIFNGLEQGLYNVIASDGGGCTGKSQNCIVMSSSTLSYELYVINDSNCTTNPNLGSGKIFIRDIVGVGPYNYLWSNGEITQSITGLSAGNYGVTITDSNGCVSSQTASLTKVPILGVQSTVVTSPTCYGNDGTITLTISGGTAPYYYQVSNGDNIITFDSTIYIQQLGAGIWTINVTDAGLCTVNTSINLLVPNIFNVLSVNTTNPVCGNSSGNISIVLNGGTPPYTFKLINSFGNISSITSLLPSILFSNLSADTYNLIITDKSNLCTYQEYVVLSASYNFLVTASVTNESCSSSNGSVTITKSVGGLEPFTYNLNNNLFSSPTNSLTYTFNSLPAGNYNVGVTDSTGCTQYTAFSVGSLTNVNFSLSKTDATNGNNGTINAYISNGTPPFILTWSNNVNGQTGTTLNSLSAGTYTLSVTDDNECTKTLSIVIGGLNVVNNYQIYTICEGVFTDTGVLQKRGIEQMLAEGYFDIADGNINCILNSAILSANVTVNDVLNTQVFYTSTSLNDVPPNSLWFDTITSMLLGVYGVSSVIIDEETNSIKILTNCDISDNILNDATVLIDLSIDYDVSCVSCP
jgi:hypothetical protein